MCGISVVLSKNKNKNVIPFITNSLKQLQNRGYDSFGLACFIHNNNNININKHICDVNCVTNTNNIDDFNLFSNNISHLITNIAIAHTRWATHGSITIENSHPHISNSKNICLVHNGIIENYIELKNMLLKYGYIFYSETDTEIIVNLIEYFYIQHNNITQSIQYAINMLEGTYGLAIMCKDNQDEIYIVKNGSPIILGENDNYIIATSEPSGFVNEIKNYIVIDNKNIITLSLNNGIINNKNNSIIHHEQNSINLTPHPYDHWTMKEIMEQEHSILRSINNGARIFNNTIKLGGLTYLKPHIKNIKNIIFLGCGTSLNACEIGAIYSKNIKCVNYVNCIDAADFELNDIPLQGNTLLIMCSQSGETKDLHKVLEMIKNKNNIITLGIINQIDSLIAREVDCGIYLNAGREVAVASTKSFTSTVMVLKLFSLWLLQDNNNIINNSIYDDIRKVNIQIKDILNNNLITNHHISFFNQTNLFILGKNTMKYIAYETALKMKEICYIHAEGYSATALKHGPFALLDENFPVILLINKVHQEKMWNVYKEIQSRKAKILVITEIKDIDIPPENCILVPENKTCQEILYTIALQLLCYKIAISKNINPDKPKNLAKVVTVE
jgi:glutamine---fructose-6-phosphate transaminase (isomerizing)